MEEEEKRPVLVAVDFSEDSRAALVWACRMSELTKAPILVLHVVHDPAEAPGTYKQNEKDNLRPMEDVAEKMMADFLESLGGCGVSADVLERIGTRLVRGLPVTRILEVAEKERAAMIVMGSQGRTGLDRLLLGSKAEQVVRLSPIPVTIVKSEPKAGEE